MTRRGRKRKPGRRQPNGKLVPEKRPDDRLRIASQPHRRDLPEKARTSELAATVLGRLLLRHLLTSPDDPQEQAESRARRRYDAGSRYAAVVGAYRAVIGAPSGTAGSGRGITCPVQDTGEVAACAVDPDGCECLRRRKRYEGAFEALAGAGRAAELAVKRTVIQDEPPAGPDELVNLRAGLDRLARHFGLT